MTLTTAVPVNATSLAALGAELTGRLVLPADPDYAALATPWNVAVPSQPAAVVVAADATDVATTLAFAGDRGFTVDVRATGHGAAPVGPSTMLVHTGDLTELTVHPEGWARVGAGVRWAALIEAAAPHGLAPLCGSAPGVGVVGYLTGGGLGPVARTFGFSSDHVRAFEVATGDGELRRATPTENSALFWGLRGGKGALGIVTAVELDLPAVSELYAGCLYFDGADAAAVLHGWRAWTASLPEQASTSLAIVRLPNLPGVPAPLAGRCSVAVRFAWVGDPAEGEAAIAPVRALAPVVLGDVGTVPYASIGAIHADPVDPMPTHETVQLLDGLPTAAVDALLAVAGPASDSPQVIVELRLLGGAIARPAASPDALSHRGAAFSLLTVGIAAPPVAALTAADATAITSAMAPWTTGGALPNFGGALTPETARRSYEPAVLDRLHSLAVAYDPGSVLAGAHAVRATAGRHDR